MDGEDRSPIVREDRVYREAHPDHVNPRAGIDPEPFVGGEAGPSEKSAKPRGEGSCDVHAGEENATVLRENPRD